MPSKTPFLMGNGEGATALADAAPAGPAAAPPNAAPHDAASDVFRKSRLDARLLITILPGLESETKSKVKGKRQESFRLSTFNFRLSSDSFASRKPVEINLRVPLLIRLKQFVPRHFPSAVGGRPSKHGGQRRLHAFGSLVVEIAAGDALDEGFLLLGIGLGEVVAEGARGGKLCGVGLCGRVAAITATPGPRFVAIDGARTRVVRFRDSLAAEEALVHVPPALVKLSRVECDVNVARIAEDHVEVIVHVPGVRADLAAAHALGFDGVGLQHPVANVDGVNVLLHDDIPGKHAVPHPVADALLDR